MAFVLEVVSNQNLFSMRFVLEESKEDDTASVDEEKVLRSQLILDRN